MIIIRDPNILNTRNVTEIVRNSIANPNGFTYIYDGRYKAERVADGSSYPNHKWTAGVMGGVMDRNPAYLAVAEENEVLYAVYRSEEPKTYVVAYKHPSFGPKFSKVINAASPDAAADTVRGRYEVLHVYTESMWKDFLEKIKEGVDW